LEELRIRGLGVIDDAVLTLGPGLTAVTGETGAGKTMVVTGLLLLFGGRADSARVRPGAAQTSVDGRIELARDSALIDRVRDAGGSLDDGTALVLRRVVTAAGRSRAFVGGAPAPVAVLAELADGLVAVHGQADQVRLARPAEQRAALDRFADLELAEFAAAYARWRAAVDALADRTARRAELRREADLLAYGISEIEAVNPEPGEDVELSLAASRLAHADALRRAAHDAHDALLGDAADPASDALDVATLLGAARRGLSLQLGADPQLDALADRLSELAAVVADLGADLAGYADGLDADPTQLAQVESRRAAVTALIRKYADGPEAGVTDALRWAANARSRLAELDVSDDAMLALAAERDTTAAIAAALAAQLSAARGSAASRLSAAITAELADLALASATVTIAVRPRPVVTGAPTLTVNGAEVAVGPDGADEVEFLFRSHPSAPALPLGGAASGGELSRVMLAVELCLAGSDPVPTMVFDEVDAGVGGRAAVEVGRRLARLAREHQVIVVTHLPQVAAFADRQVVVGRSEGAGVSTSDVRIVTGAQRTAELARMLAGTQSGTAREHADELLAAAAAERGQRRSGRDGTGRTAKT
ncbi:MAG TPA: DNA repair protein RecN, partial [Actinospica sp.]|nr:DNA repair protein RecN [Actinospica sp.]